jgi:hypothetical protein
MVTALFILEVEQLTQVVALGKAFNLPSGISDLHLMQSVDITIIILIA